MNDLIKFIILILFILVPFGITVVWTLYLKTIVFWMALLVFFASMFCAIVGYSVSYVGWNSLYWAIPLCLFALLTTISFIKKWIQKPVKTYAITLKIGRWRYKCSDQGQKPGTKKRDGRYFYCFRKIG
jgi:hypothetical protein